MKGTPLLRALLLLAVLLLLAWPLSRVTAPAQAQGPFGTELLPVTPPTVTPEKLPLTLSFTRIAERIEIRHLGVLVWAKNRPGLRESPELGIPFPQEGIELVVIVHWQGTDLSALRLQLTTPDGTELERSAWGSETMEAVLSFP